MNRVLTALASQWKLVLLVTLTAGVGIALLEPDYNKLQMAKDADAFRSILGSQDGRAFGAALCDFIFAAAYGLLGVIVFRKLGPSLAATIGTILVVAAALVDELENVLVVLNVGRADTLTDTWVNAMTSVGAIKWALGAGALLTLAFVAIRALARSRR